MQVAQFVAEEDHVPFELTASIYEVVKQEYQGYRLTTFGGNRIKCWLGQEGQVIIGCRGTSVHLAGGFNDLLDDVHLSAGGECALSIVRDGSQVLDQMKQGTLTTFTIGSTRISTVIQSIIVCGHSLGGAASFCLARKYPQVTRAISFNGAAPILSEPHLGAGKDRSRFYHIVGDIISTHIDQDSCEVFRIKLPGLVNWNNPGFYHTTARFYTEEGVEFWTPQNEQDDIQDYVYHSTISSFLITLVTGVVTKYLHRDRLRELVCQHPIPGSQSGGPCSKDYGLGRTGGVFGAFAGGYLGYILGASAAAATVVAATPFFVAGVAAAPLAGAYLGYNLAMGQGLLDLTNPIEISRRRGLIRG